MQGNLGHASAASDGRAANRLALFAGVPLIAALAFSTPSLALAACGASHPAGVHTATAKTGVNTATSAVKTSAGGGSGTLGCANGASAPAPHGLSIASSGRVIEGRAHPAAHAATHARTGATKTANASAHLRGVKPAHHL